MYPITNAQFVRFGEDGGYSTSWQGCWTEAGLKWKADRTGPNKLGGVFDLPNHPVVGVSWYEAVAFCNWLSEKLGIIVTLPTEAQWERAARGIDGRRYPWGKKYFWDRKTTPDQANYSMSKVNQTSAVGMFPKGISPCGAYDMSGNVWEWCLTRWRDNSAGPENNDLEGTELRVLRGGAFDYSASFMRCEVRLGYDPSDYDKDFGFRVVAPPITEDPGLNNTLAPRR